MINETRAKINEDKLNFYLLKQYKVHITKEDGEWLNGILVEKEAEGVYILKESKFGLMHIFISEIKEVEEYHGEKEKEAENL